MVKRRNKKVKENDMQVSLNGCVSVIEQEYKTGMSPSPQSNTHERPSH
jgi:hypothetical protein